MPTNFLPKNPLTPSLVISHFNEDLDWIPDFVRVLQTRLPLPKEDQRVYIYLYHKLNSEFNAEQLEPKLKTFKIFFLDLYGVDLITSITYLPNNGREALTYLHHMLYRSEAFTGINIFLQGKPHCTPEVCLGKWLGITEKFTDSLGNFERNWRANEMVSFSDSETGLHSEDIRQTAFICHTMLLKYGSDPTAHPGGKALSFRRRKQICASCELEIDKLVQEVSTPPRLTKDELKRKRIAFSWRGEFLATDAAIRRMVNRHRDRLQLYYTLASLSNAPDIAHILERTWLTLFRGVSGQCSSNDDISSEWSTSPLIGTLTISITTLY